MKNSRQTAIRALLREQKIQTQEELAEALRSRGFRVTQATVSRDMKEMHLIKASDEEGGYRYAEPEAGWNGTNERQIRLLRDCIVKSEAAGQMIVVKTMSGSAGTAAEALDSLELQGVVGSIAGDNTIFLVARDPDAAKDAVERIESLIR